MDLENEVRIKELADKYGMEDLLVVHNRVEAEAADLAVKTVSAGDPTYADPFAGVSLGLKVYHLFELKEKVNAVVYEEQIGMMEMVPDMDTVISEVSTYRG